MATWDRPGLPRWAGPQPRARVAVRRSPPPSAEQSGFVTRKPSPDSRRAIVVSATRAGQAMRVLARIEANLTTPPPEEHRVRREP
ncbi:hypothetical protein [Streptomyces sp. NPDC093109]|uniref:hypothetical protein n=1 Tax=Streptomyces sp. NPDC093109 TaxID=3154977 RepID=UPI00344C4924